MGFHKPLIRPGYFLGGVALGGVARIPMISQTTCCDIMISKSGGLSFHLDLF